MADTCSPGISGTACHLENLADNAMDGFGIGNDISHEASKLTGDALSSLANGMASAADGLLKTLSTFWMKVDTPQLQGAGSAVATIQKDTGWITTCMAVVFILVAAARMAIRRRGEPAQTLMMGLTRLVVVSASATFLIEAAGKLGDQFSSDLMSTAHIGSGGWSEAISVTGLSATFAAGDGMLLIVSVLIIISALIQLMFMVLRTGLLIILTGTLPLAAAASMSDWGESWWRKHLGWLTAWLLYKPAAAVLFVSAFTLTQGKRSIEEVTAGFMILILSVLILPALLKVIVPMTSALGAASSGSLAMAATGALATGAIRVAAATSGGKDPSASGAAAMSKGPDGAEVSAAGTAGDSAAPDNSERPVVPPSGSDPGSEPPGSTPEAGPDPGDDPGDSPAGGNEGAGPDAGEQSAGSDGSDGPGGPGGSNRPDRPGDAPGNDQQGNENGPSGADSNGDDEIQESGG